MKRLLLLCLLSVASLSAAQAKPQTFIGVITDNMCARADHSQMQMGPTDADCTRECINAHGAVYVLYNGTSAYTLSDQKTPAQFAAQKVRVTGTLDATTKTIKVDSIIATK